MLQHLKWRSLEDRRRGVPCHDVFIKSPTTRLQSVKVTDFHHPWDTPETCTLDHIRSHYVEHNRERNRHDKTEILLKVALSTINPNATKKGFIFPSNHSRLEPPTLDSSAEWLSRVIQDCHDHISSLNSLPALYIFLNLFLIVFFFLFFFLFRIAIQWHNLQTVEVGH